VVQVLLLGRCVNVIRSGKNMTTIRTVVSPVSTAEEKGLLNKPMMPVVTDVDMASLKVNLAKLMRDLNELFEAQAADTGFGLKQIEVGVEITAEGGVNLIGTMTAGATASISLTFERP
jgi:translation elongation factor EF-1beta